jgi:hypothetical protein
MMLILSVAGFGVIINETLLGSEFATPDDDTVPTKATVLLQGHVNVPINTPAEFAPGLNVIIKIPESPEVGVTGLMVNTFDPAEMVKDPTPNRPDTVHVCVCDSPGAAVNVVDPLKSTGQAVAVRLKMDIEHSSMRKAATLKNEVR